MMLNICVEYSQLQLFDNKMETRESQKKTFFGETCFVLLYRSQMSERTT